jgi:hypothetical protein
VVGRRAVEGCFLRDRYGLYMVTGVSERSRGGAVGSEWMWDR